MSIIAEALKRAEKERDKTIDSREYLNKILGPPRKATVPARPEPKEEKPAAPADVHGLGKKDSNSASTDKVLVFAGGLLLLTIIFLTGINIFVIRSSETETAAVKAAPAPEADLPEAEAYTDMSSDIKMIDRPNFIGRMANALKGASGRERLISSFTLSGIVYDIKDPWAIVNNKIVRTGDVLNGAKVLSVGEKKVTMSYGDETFDLVVK